MLDEAPKEGEGLKINGSVMLAVAESKKEVLEVLKKDVYCTSGVWDWDKVQIHAVSVCGRLQGARNAGLLTLMLCIPSSKRQSGSWRDLTV